MRDWKIQDTLTLLVLVLIFVGIGCFPGCTLITTEEECSTCPTCNVFDVEVRAELNTYPTTDSAVGYRLMMEQEECVQ